MRKIILIIILFYPISSQGINAQESYEPFTDTNQNGVWDDEEFYTDSNNNGNWDSAEPFIDSGNGIWDAAEPYIDKNNNHINTINPIKISKAVPDPKKYVLELLDRPRESLDCYQEALKHKPSSNEHGGDEWDKLKKDTNKAIERINKIIGE